jgi:hypothetical protein
MENLRVNKRGSSPILHSTVTDVIEAEEPAEIRRADSEKVALISANLVGRDLEEMIFAEHKNLIRT